MPSRPYDAKGLLAAAIRDDNPVIFLEQKLLFFGEPEPVPGERYALELGSARVAREGQRRHRRRARRHGGHALRAARELEAEGIDVEVVDPCTLVPLDTETILASGEDEPAVVAHEAVRFGGFGGEIASQIAEHASGSSTRRSSGWAPPRIRCRTRRTRARDPARAGGHRGRGPLARRALTSRPVYESRRSTPSARWSPRHAVRRPGGAESARCARYQSYVAQSVSAFDRRGSQPSSAFALSIETKESLCAVR